MQTSQACYNVNWTGTTPIFTQFETTVAAACATASYFSASMTPDGKTLFVKPFNGSLYYTRFNTTTNQFVAFTNAGFTAGRLGVAVNANASIIWISDNTNDTYRTITWIGDTATFSTASTASSHAFDDRGFVLIGGDTTGSVQPKYLLSGNGGVIAYPFNAGVVNTTGNTLISTYFPGTNGVSSNQIFTACGPKGNIFYFSNSSTIISLTLNVT